jgi:putative oxidoreductase
VICAGFAENSPVRESIERRAIDGLADQRRSAGIRADFHRLYLPIQLDALKQATSSWLPGGAVLLILAMIVELFTPPMIVFRMYDGLAAFILAGYCVVTGIVYHAFWTYPRFWSPQSEGYPHIWDFFKNFGLVGGLIFVMYESGFIQAVGGEIERVSALVV